MSTGQYEVRPEAMRATAGNVGGIIMQTINTAMDLESTLVNTGSFAVIGDAVASANAAMQGQQVAALRSLAGLLQKANDHIRQSADDYDTADRDVAAGFGGPGDAPQSTSLWSSPAASALAAHAIGDSTGAAGEPTSVGNVLGYLSRAGLGDVGGSGVDGRFAEGGAFADWLDASSDNQASLGLIGTYSGDVRDLGDVPGGVQAGDVVVIGSSSSSDGSSIIGVAGNNGQLYNHGPITPEFERMAAVRVYRPMAG